jgi:hypothetical protein
MVEITCPQCNYAKSIPPEKIPPGVRWIRCPNCGNRFEYLKKEEDVSAEKRHATPWERRLELGLWRGIKQTLKSVVFSPTNMFCAMPVRGGWREPLAFGLLVGSISSMLDSFWKFMISTSGLINPLGSLSTSLSSPVIFLSLIFLSPLLVILDLFISSLLIHLLLLLVGGAKNGSEATFRVVAYSEATGVWSIIPFIGGLIGWVWKTIVLIIGLKEAHEISYSRIVVAFSIPLALLLLALASALFLIMRL